MKFVRGELVIWNADSMNTVRFLCIACSSRCVLWAVHYHYVCSKRGTFGTGAG